MKNALIHKSYHEGMQKDLLNNEKLEFLGDSVINLVITDFLFKRFKKLKEGELSKLKAHLVSTNFLFEIAQSINLSDYIFLGKGEEKNNGLAEDEKYVTCLAIDPSDPSILYAGISGAGKVLKTQDGGNTWERKVDGLPPNESVIRLSIGPYNPQILYAGTSVGFYASIDGGDTWEFRDGGLGQRYIRSLAIDPMDSMKVCAGTYDDGVFASIDGGKNWTQIDQGLTGDLNKRIISLAIDVRETDNPVAYAGTGCGVFKAYE